MIWPAVAIIPVVGITAAVDATDGIDPTTLVGQISSGLGLATFAWLFVSGRIVSRQEHERVVAQNTAWEAVMLTQVIPNLTRIVDFLDDDDPPPRAPRRRT